MAKTNEIGHYMEAVSRLRSELADAMKALEFQGDRADKAGAELATCQVRVAELEAENGRLVCSWNAVKRWAENWEMFPHSALDGVAKRIHTLEAELAACQGEIAKLEASRAERQRITESYLASMQKEINELRFVPRTALEAALQARVAELEPAYKRCMERIAELERQIADHPCEVPVLRMTRRPDLVIGDD